MAADDKVEPPPRKPLTGYSIFFRLERCYIYQVLKKIPSDIPLDQRFNYREKHDCTLLDPLPERYRGIVIRKDFHIYSGDESWDGQKRKHRKIVGRPTMPLSELSKMVSENWREADDDVITYCEALAAFLKRKHEEQLREYNEQVEEELRRKAAETDDRSHPSSSQPSSGFSNVPEQTCLWSPACNELGQPHPYMQLSMEQSFVNWMSMSQKPSFIPRMGNVSNFNAHPLAAMGDSKKSLYSQQVQNHHREVSAVIPQRTGILPNLMPRSSNPDQRHGYFKQQHIPNHHQQGGFISLSCNYRKSNGHSSAVPSPKSAPQTQASLYGSPQNQKDRSKSSAATRDAPSPFSIFCQLEKQHILQRELEVPHYDMGRYYSGPRFDPKKLPPRYQELIIPADFYKLNADNELGDLMHFNIMMPNGIELSCDISTCVERRWKTKVDLETLTFCDFLHRYVLHNNLHKKIGDQTREEAHPTFAKYEPSEKPSAKAYPANKRPRHAHTSMHDDAYSLMLLHRNHVGAVPKEDTSPTFDRKKEMAPSNMAKKHSLCHHDGTATLNTEMIIRPVVRSKTLDCNRNMSQERIKAAEEVKSSNTILVNDLPSKLKQRVKYCVRNMSRERTTAVEEVKSSNTALVHDCTSALEQRVDAEADAFLKMVYESSPDELEAMKNDDLVKSFIRYKEAQ